MPKNKKRVTIESIKPSNQVTARKSVAKTIFGLDSFRFWNADSYIGNYQAMSPNIILKKGLGKYITSVGEMYTGEWDKDKLLHGSVKYKDFSEYYGQFDDHKYIYAGIYKIPNVGELRCEFKYNIPQGTVFLTDIKGREWFGHEVSAGKIELHRRNHFKINIKEDDENYYDSQTASKTTI